MSLDEIGIKHRTDKSSLRHHYLSIFELLFRRFKGRPINFLEVGCQFGNSLKSWRDYFGPDATIIGIDSIDNNIGGCITEPNQLIVGDAYTNEMVVRAKRSVFGKYQVCLDDGSHTEEDQMWFVRNYSSLVADDGLLIVEDIAAPKTIPLLVMALPPEFEYAAVDMTQGGQVDSRLFIAYRK